MVTARSSILISRSPEEVFDFVGVNFVSNYRRWSPEVQRLDLLTPGPLRVGSRARQFRVDRGRRSETIFRVDQMDQPARIDFAEVTGLFRTRYWLDSVGAQTRLNFAFELNRIDLYMRPFEKLIRAAIQDGAEQVVRNIKGLLEADDR